MRIGIQDKTALVFGGGLGEVHSGAALPGLHPANAEMKPRYEAFRRAQAGERA
jgi:hypothetical protein